jgi:transcription initiation factor TFIIE subunit alpha
MPKKSILKDPLTKSMIIDVIKEEENLPIVQALIDGVSTDEEIAEKTEIRLNIVRKVLYKLYDAKLASYKRSKDPETQWYTYAWKFDTEEVSQKMENKANSLINNLERQLQNEESSMFFACPHGHSRFNFDNASELGFICPDCGEEIVFEDNANKIEKIKEKIDMYKDTYKTALSDSGK